MGQKTYRAAAIGHTGAGNYGHGLHIAYKGLENVSLSLSLIPTTPDERRRWRRREHYATTPIIATCLPKRNWIS